MSLNREIYEKAKTTVAGTAGLSPALDAYAQAYFTEPPVTGEWTGDTMQEELYRLLWDYHNGCIDIRRRSAKSILRERLQSARTLLETMEQEWKLARDERDMMSAFIHRFRLKELYKEYLEDIGDGEDLVMRYFPDEELPFV